MYWPRRERAEVDGLWQAERPTTGWLPSRRTGRGKNAVLERAGHGATYVLPKCHGVELAATRSDMSAEHRTPTHDACHGARCLLHM